MSRTDKFRRAYIGGTFDCLHRGHIALFANVREVANEVVVSLNTDEFAARYKRQPLMSLADRFAVIDACRLIDRVIVNSGDEDSKIAIVVANVDCIIHGDDWTGESLMNQMGLDAEWLQSNGISLVTVPYTQHISTTQILNAYAKPEPAIPTLAPGTATCATCNRLVLVEHLDTDGNCNEHSLLVGHIPTEAEWADLGRPEGQ